MAGVALAAALEVEDLACALPDVDGAERGGAMRDGRADVFA
jgi:hypothetical protein